MFSLLELTKTFLVFLKSNLVTQLNLFLSLVSHLTAEAQFSSTVCTQRAFSAYSLKVCYRSNYQVAHNLSGVLGVPN